MRKQASAKVPATTPSGRDSVSIYQRLRGEILKGTLPPGHVLNTVHIADEYQVSRTPVREALRMLQTEGLVDAEYQHRMRVTAITAEEVDAVYATWILMQSLAVGLTVPLTTDQELGELQAALDAMNAIEQSGGRARTAWDRHHSTYLQCLVRHAGPSIIRTIENCWLRSERARHFNSKSASRPVSNGEHTAVVNAFIERDAGKAILLECKHLSRVALDVIKKIDGDYEPRAIQQALRLALGQHGASAT